MTSIFFNAWRIISAIIVLALLMLFYVGLPESLAIKHNEVGRPIAFMDKQNFYYLTVAVVVGFNFLVTLLRDAIIKLDYKKVAPNSSWAATPERLTNEIKSWSNALMAIVNTFLIFIMLGIRSINVEVSQNLDRNYDWLLIGGAIALLIVLAYLPIRLLFTKPSAEI